MRLLNDLKQYEVPNDDVDGVALSFITTPPWTRLKKPIQTEVPTKIISAPDRE